MGTRNHARAVVVMAAMLLSGIAADSASAAAPSLRLIAADHSVTVKRSDVESAYGWLWVAAVGGDVRVSVRRPGYRAWQAQQVDPVTGAPLRQIPSGLLDPPIAFKRFLAVRFVDGHGRVAGRRALPLGLVSEERVSEDGPRNPTYSERPGLDYGTGFPFRLGTIWGLDNGWATEVQYALPGGGYGRHLRLAPGRYLMVVTIRAPFRQAFGVVAPGQARVQIHVRVKHGAVRQESPLPYRLVTTAQRQRHATAASAAAPDQGSLPDLVALPPWHLGLHHHHGHDLLGFAATPWNAGPGPLDVEGFRSPDSKVMAAVQYFIRPDGTVTGSAPAGEMEFHAHGGHDHWHFRQFVSYTLLTRNGNRVVQSHKRGFCLGPSDAVDLTVPGAVLNTNPRVFTGNGCDGASALWRREELPAGWGDTYSPYVSGQDFDVTHVPNGRYLVEMHVNPLGQLHETTTANDIARRRVTLSGRPGHRRVEVAPWHGITG